MKVQFFDSYCWFVAVIVIGSFVFLAQQLSGGLELILNFSGAASLCNGQYFIFDTVSFFLCLLSVFLLFVVLFLWADLSCRSIFFIIISVVSACMCYCSNHVFLFWWCYEVSILSLLFLIVIESPYSERYIASWYLCGYVVLTSLPMLLCLFYLSSEVGSFFLSDWSFCDFGICNYNIGILLLLGVLFITKIPVLPFHVWLPIVHAEATSVVSVCLSGYIMKLGILGVCRFCWCIVSVELFCTLYVVVSLFAAVFFFFSACRELDGKRWLAFLSLSHIVICVVCLYSGFYDTGALLFVYSLGHGLSASLVFVLLWWAYELCGTRNWMIVKSVFGGSLFFRGLLCLSLCTAASFPPVIQFFVEVFVMHDVGFVSVILFCIFCAYLFFSSLVPFFLLGSLLTRQFCVSFTSFMFTGSFNAYCIFVLFWSFLVFIVL